MKSLLFSVSCAVCVAGAVGATTAMRPRADTAETHRAAALAAAGKDYPELYRTLCVQTAAPPQRGQTSAAARPRPQGPPERSQWHAEPVKVFDNLYWLGQTEYSVWAVTTSQGIILIDTIFDYSVDDEVVEGLKKVGLNPEQIKYAIVSHGHNDHSGGAKYIQERFNAHVILSAADWDLLSRTPDVPKPKRDMVATDGQRLTLGDTTLTLYLTPGHTPGTISTLIPVKDHGQPHMVAEWGGSAFNFTITPEKPRLFWFKTYIESAERFRMIAARAGADVVISNHTMFDGSKVKLPALATRKAGEPNPFVVGADSVNRYMTVAEECAKASLADLTDSSKE
jgi:metallo-beta-lactamase class B